MTRALTPTAAAKRCAFCGRATRNASGFCTPCVREGFDSVYFCTGRTSNGWEWRERWNARPHPRRVVVRVTDIWSRTYAGSDRPAALHPWKCPVAFA